METKILKKTNEILIIDWSDDSGYGQLTIKYNERGGYIVDAEYISMEKVIEILKNI